jgi:hypothetical protein
MTWLFAGMLLGSIVTSSHETREACEGRAVLLREKGVIGQCVQQTMYLPVTTPSGNIITLSPSR